MESPSATTFAMRQLDMAVGEGAGDAWRARAKAGAGLVRERCARCGDGFDSAAWHAATCPAEGRVVGALRDGVAVRFARLRKAELNGCEGVLKRFEREQHRWAVEVVGGKTILLKAANLELAAA